MKRLIIHALFLHAIILLSVTTHPTENSTLTNSPSALRESQDKNHKTCSKCCKQCGNKKNRNCSPVGMPQVDIRAREQQSLDIRYPRHEQQQKILH